MTRRRSTVSQPRRPGWTAGGRTGSGARRTPTGTTSRPAPARCSSSTSDTSSASRGRRSSRPGGGRTRSRRCTSASRAGRPRTPTSRRSSIGSGRPGTRRVSSARTTRSRGPTGSSFGTRGSRSAGSSSPRRSRWPGPRTGSTRSRSGRTPPSTTAGGTDPAGAAGSRSAAAASRPRRWSAGSRDASTVRRRHRLRALPPLVGRLPLGRLRGPRRHPQLPADSRLVGADRLDIFALGEDNACWHRWWNGHTWGGWESLGGTFMGKIAAVCWGPKRIDLFGVGTDRGLDHGGGTGTRGAAGSRSAACSPPPDRRLVGRGPARVFALGEDNACGHRWWDATPGRLGSLGASVTARCSDELGAEPDRPVHERHGLRRLQPVLGRLALERLDLPWRHPRPATLGRRAVGGELGGVPRGRLRRRTNSAAYMAGLGRCGSSSGRGRSRP